MRTKKLKIRSLIHQFYFTWVLSLLIIATPGCKKLVEVDPPVTSLSETDVYKTDETAIAVLTGIYTNMSSNNLLSGGITSMSFWPGLSADEFTLYGGLGNMQFTEYYTNALTKTGAGSEFWNSIYPMIFVTNSAIEGLTATSSLTPSVKQQLLGEAKFVRAFCYFYLVNLYGDVPLVLSSDYKINEVAARAPKAQIWQQITDDLKSSEELLSADYLDITLLNNTPERVRPTKWAASALLARTYLYTEKWANAEAEADSVINNSSLYNLSMLDNVFLTNSSEAIWQLQPVGAGWNTQDAQLFIIPSTGPSGNWPVYLSRDLLNSFEIGDQRRTNWVDSVFIGDSTYYFPYKYKSDSLNAPLTEYEMVLRLGEQYLIRAEARIQQGNTSGAIADLNTIRARAGLPSTTASSQSDLLIAILHERQVELFSEWGHRWLDLKRTGAVDVVMGTPGGVCASKGGNWNTDWQWYPISLYEIQHDPNLVENSGY